MLMLIWKSIAQLCEYFSCFASVFLLNEEILDGLDDVLQLLVVHFGMDGEGNDAVAEPFGLGE